MRKRWQRRLVQSTKWAIQFIKNYWLRIIQSLAIAAVFTILIVLLPVVSPIRQAFQMYYVETLPRVQTVDFNMLFHMLPLALSQASNGKTFREIFTSRHAESIEARNIKKILDSNYGVFSLIVTSHEITPDKLTDQTILYKTTKSQDLRDVLKEGYVIHSDLIVYPQPVCSVASYSDPKAIQVQIDHDCQNQIESVVRSGNSKIIGRLHYVRGVTPNFVQNFLAFLTDFWGDASGYAFFRASIFYTVVWFLVFLLLILVVAIWSQFTEERQKLERAEYKQRIAERERELAETRAKVAEAEKEIAEKRAKLLESEAQLNRLRKLDEIIRSVFDSEFSAPLGNSMQIIESAFQSATEEIDNDLVGIITRLKNDVNNIQHDLCKAPVLNKPDWLDERIRMIAATENINERIMQVVCTLLDIDKSIIIISQLRQDLNQIVSLEPQECLVFDLMKSVYNRARERLTKANFIFHYQSHSLDELQGDNERHKIWINPWHFQSILKNVIDNSYAACIKARLKGRIGGSQVKEIKIIVSCTVDESQKRCVITVEDNGPGIPEDIIEYLYRSPRRLNPDALRGNGSIICYAYLSFWGAQARAENLDSGGARVTLEFPLQRC